METWYVNITLMASSPCCVVISYIYLPFPSLTKSQMLHFFSLNAQSLSAEEERRLSACFEFVSGNLGNKLPLLPKRNNNNNY